MDESLLNDVLSLLKDVSLLVDKQNKLLSNVYDLLKKDGENNDKQE